MQLKAMTCLNAAALVVWGWQTNLLGFGIALAAVVIGADATRRRWTFAPRELARIWDVTMLIVIGAAIYNRQTAGISVAVFTFLQWLPLLFFPLIAAALFSNNPRLPYSTFLFWWRRRRIQNEGSVDVRGPYFALCLLSASASSRRDGWFYPVVIGLIGSAIWAHRTRRLRPGIVVPLFLAITLSGYFLQARWREFTVRMENTTMSWLVGFFPRQFEDQETYTDLGQIGQLKSSGRVLMRVRHVGATNLAPLLRQVSFDQYRRGIWLSTRRNYSAVAETAPGTWELKSAGDALESVSISASVPTGQILLPLPLGAHRVRNLPAARLERNRFGNLRVWDSPDPLRCTVDYDPKAISESAVDKNDLQVAVIDESAVRDVVNELGLASMPAESALQTVADFFNQEFRYASFVALPPPSPSSAASPITTFLTQTRAGHCEYFATAAVLLLRKVGIPARYAVGYALVEPCGSDGEFTVRERHTHSWVLAYVNGRWRDFDPTPARWNRSEMARASVWRPVGDWWSDLRFGFATWQWWPEVDRRVLFFLLLPCAAGLVWTLLRRQRQVRVRARRKPLAAAFAWPGLDSEFFLIERALQKRGFSREPEETTAVLMRRAVRAKLIELEGLLPALNLHYKYRFDPEGLEAEDRRQLADVVHRWLEKQN